PRERLRNAGAVASGAHHRARATGAADDLVDEAVSPGLLGVHEVVALGVTVDDLELLAGVLGEDLVQPVAQEERLAGVDLDVGGLAAEAARHLVDEHPRVRQAVAHPRGAPARMSAPIDA